ncbi:hypothetical protein [Microvirga flavescens]|uniref:hypothetical protein n=1 Tax=Microvirga flavescens TaxID=2249811 RepID=UPI000DD9F6D7|nr:hypothetical protein [Microvirga flavescens]
MDTLASEKIWVAYGCAVTAAVALFIAQSVLIAVFWRAKTVFELSQPFESAILLTARAVFLWTTALASNFVPFFIVVFAAQVWAIRSLTYYILCALLIGLVMTPLFSALLPSTVAFTGPSTGVWERSLSIGPCLLLSYVAGALGFWWQAGRFIGENN